MKVSGARNISPDLPDGSDLNGIYVYDNELKCNNDQNGPGIYMQAVQGRQPNFETMTAPVLYYNSTPRVKVTWATNPPCP